MRKDILFGCSKHIFRYGYLRRDVKHMESLKAKIDQSKLIIFNSNTKTSTRLEVLMQNDKLALVKLCDHDLLKKEVIDWLDYNVFMQSYVDEKNVPNIKYESRTKLFWLGFDDKNALTNDVNSPIYSIDVAGKESLCQYVERLIDEDSLNLKYSIGMSDVVKLENEHATAYSYGKIFMDFLGKHKFCASCGGHVTPVELGSRLYCLNDNDNDNDGDKCQVNLRPNNLQYPRTDPVVIISLYDPTTKNGRILLGCNRKRHPAVETTIKDPHTGLDKIVKRTMFSCFAGFMEPGETIENACIREVHEETGLRLNSEDITIIESQPWPFPSNLMIGCIGILKGDQLKDSNIDIHLDDELDDAQWFPAKEVGEVVKGAKFGILNGDSENQWHTPQMQSVAGRLITRCVENCLNVGEGKL